MDSVKTIRAIERAFDVLRTLQGRPDGATLKELERATALSGPTLLRILKTLIAERAIRRSTTDQRYRNGVLLQALVSGTRPIERFADVAAPVLDSLCRRVEWPSDLVVHLGDDDYMTVLESSLRQSRFYVRRPRGRVRVNLLGSAAGTAFLAALAPARRQQLLDAARLGRDIHNAKAIATGDLDQRVEQARRQGYATRHPLFRGGGYNNAGRDDSLDAIAVPITRAGLVLGAININWNRSAHSEREVVRKHLGALRDAADQIAKLAWESGVLDDLPGVEAADPLF